MNRRNLAFGALFSIILMTGVAWYGEKAHYIPALKPPPEPQTPLPAFTLDPDPQVPIEVEPAKPVQKDDITPPSLPDNPVARPQPDDFTVPIEPPQTQAQVIDLVRIPQGSRDPATGIRPFDLGQLDQQPVPKYQARAAYPREMREAGVSGEVVVDFIVDPSGDVRNEFAVHSSNHEFEEPACRAVSRWKFKPGRKGGRAVFVHMQVPIVFRLDEGD